MTTTDLHRIYDTMEYGPAKESNEQALRWIEDHQHCFDLFIEGQWQAPQAQGYFATLNHATGECLAKIAQADAADVDRAVAAAAQAQPQWAALGGHARARYLYALARQIQKHSRLFSVLETLDNGKPIRESRDIDIPLVARHFYHHAGWAQLMADEFADYQPLGVVGQIIPWNFPLLMLSWKVAPALAMGNTVVLKPAELTSLTALLFAELCLNVGLPAGVLNIVTGDGSTGAHIVEHPGVAKIAFTGSTEVGRMIRQATAGSGKKLSLELGGKSPFIVFEDSDLDSAVEGLVDAIWFNQGQVCCAGSRLLVQESVAEAFIGKIKQRLEHFRIGDPLDKSIDMGSVIDPVQLQKIQGLVQQGVDEGATLWQPSCPVPQEGCFFPPTLLTDVAPTATVAHVEIFGPVLVAMTFRTPKEAVALANNSRYGLAASIWTENINLALDIAPKVVAGSVWVNCTNLFDAAAGFGGYRESGFGREGGREGLWEYVQPKWLSSLKSVEPMAEVTATPVVHSADVLPSIDQTAKMYVGGKQCRPDSGYTRRVLNPKGQVIGEVGQGSRKDIRNAVEAAHQASAWQTTTAHHRAQVLYFIAENLEKRNNELANRIAANTGVTMAEAQDEVALCLRRIFTYAAYADKYDGRVHHTPVRNVTLAMPEAVGVMGMVCPPEVSLIGFISTVMPAIAMGNRVVVVPSEHYPLPVTDFYQVLDTSDLPGGVVNIVTGESEALTEVLAEHDGVDALWYWGSKDGSQRVEFAAAENLKRTWVNYGKAWDWHDSVCEGELFLRHATQIKNIWVPYGE